MRRNPKQTLSASLEDYLETISHIVAEKKVARVKDIALGMNVNKSSVTGALQALSAKKLINYAPYDVITLTPKGKSLAKLIVRRHEVLNEFFVRILAIDKEDAKASACKMEHALSAPLLEGLAQLVKFLEQEPDEGMSCLEKFRIYCRNEEKKKTGSSC